MMLLTNLKKQKNFFIKHCNLTSDDDETKWIIEFSVRNFQDFIMRNGSNFDCFVYLILEFSALTEEIRQENKTCYKNIPYLDRMFIMNMLILNAEVLRIELQNSLTDMRYRYPRCSHFKMRVTHSLFVKPFYYLESTDEDYVRFFISDDCEKYINFIVELRDEFDKFYEQFWDEIDEYGRCIGINCEPILGLGFMSVTPLNISMY